MAPITASATILESRACGYITDEATTVAEPFQAISNLFRVPSAQAGTSERRATKRRKLDGGNAVGLQIVEAFDASQSIVLAQVGLDLDLPPNKFKILKIPAGSPTSVSLSLESFQRKNAEEFTVSLWDTATSTGAEVLATVSPEVLDDIEPHLLAATSLTTSKEGRKKSNKLRVPFTRCILSASACDLRTLRLELELRWALGLSAVERQGLRANLRKDLNMLNNYLPVEEAETNTAWVLSDFYHAVHVPPTDEIIPPRLHQSLTDTKLYPFQKRAVNWLLRREGMEVSASGEIQTIPQSTSAAPVSFKRTQDATGQTCHVSHLRGMVVADPSSVWDANTALRGGILAEEMGLGKTVELIALMSLHRRKMPEGDIYDTYLGANVKPSAATLIISPPSILEQWKNEINRHAPELKVVHYKGLPPPSASDKDKAEATVENLMQFDVVLTTYNVLAKEIHFATPPPDRTLRNAPVYERKKCPLIEIGWWRVCLDEAQMVESGVSQAATVARIIPRINAWAVSGTPLRKDVQDLRGLLIFLRYEPFAGLKALWDRLDKPSFRAIFSQIALRHTKDMIRDELEIPKQKRVVVTVPFTAIEEQNYSEMIRQMCDACYLSPEGLPTRDDRDLDHPEVIERMREWLVRLRQTCLHAHVGRRNRKALGARNGPLRTVEEVLEVMIEQNDSVLKAEAREIIHIRMKRGHVRAYAKDVERRSETALPYYERALEEAQGYVKICREELAREKEKMGPATPRKTKLKDDDDEDVEEDDKIGRIAVLRRTLRGFLEAEHACSFFIGSSYFQIKDNENLTKPDSPEFNELQAKEDLWYGKAKDIRQELLKESEDRAQRHMKKTKRKTSTAVQTIPDLKDPKGIESRKVLDAMDKVTDTLNLQAKQLQEWRTKIVEILTTPLVDQDEGIETTGDEYEHSTKAQDELYVYMLALRTLVADRSTAVNGLHDLLVDHELKEEEKKARDDDPTKRGHAPELVLEVAKTRRHLQPKASDESLKGIQAIARSLVTNLQYRADAGDSRAATEVALMEKLLSQIQAITTEQEKIVKDLEKEQDIFRATMNARLEFYRQLQVISDTVAPWKEELNETFDYMEYGKLKRDQEAKEKDLAGLKTKHAYLTNLRREGQQQGLKHECIICQDDFEIGVLTSCGHKYCKECIQQWWHEHRNCPLCKQKLKARDFKNISFKPTMITAAEETATPSQPNSPSSATTSIYSDVSDNTMKEIKMIDLDGSYGGKVDMIARHLLQIRNTHRGAKTIIFSQFRDFLDVLRNAFKKWKIGVTSIRDKNGIQQFRNDPAIECFLLDAKSDSSGLNLVNATFVFLCEPLINPAIELQAIARVHRIGQLNDTTVFMYLISDTVERAIYDISVSRRLEHMGRNSVSTSTAVSRAATPLLQETTIDKANSKELEAVSLKQLLRKRGDGEVVGKHDLWRCLFGGKKGKDGGGGESSSRGGGGAAKCKASVELVRDVDEQIQREVERFARAEAAEGRAEAALAERPVRQGEDGGVMEG
ncbi:hypothetical protein CC80DRAFT_455455 [Byssothecium circinans]|uniref:ATP-dependent DNA helicase n=1 Tax=Byssothecium circinans TaxID=147558 RepID=A0A6A5TIW6_9PLEO|nr:hypothetical protein CC80DRAFT_455455 [Byssothecium circinans]